MNEKSGPIKQYTFKTRTGALVTVSAFNLSQAEVLAGKGSRLLTITKNNYATKD